MVHTFAELEELNIVAVWKEENTVVASHGPRPKPTSCDKGEPSIIPPASKSRGSTFEVEVREQLASLSRALGDHLDMITRCIDRIHHVEI